VQSENSERVLLDKFCIFWVFTQNYLGIYPICQKKTNLF
jgi:hypothetical protein